MQAVWRDVGHQLCDLSATAFTLGCVLEADEPYDSPRAMAQAGPRAAVTLHRAADEALAGWQNSSISLPSFADAVSGYVELAQYFEPADARYLTNHQGHLMFVKPEERPFVTAELIRDTSFTATEDVLVERIAELGDAGYTQFTVQLTPGQESAVEDWARIRRTLSR
jgi:5,10-methylenetetrahydromethanopterin reductase